LNTYDTYVILFRGLSVGDHNFHWTVDGKFFEKEDYSGITGADISVDLVLEKTEKHMKLNFDAYGELIIPCDRCLAPLSVDIDAQRSLIIKESEEGEIDDDDMVVVSRSEHQLQTAPWIREMILLSLPMKNVHDKGDCDAEMIKKLEDMSNGGETISFE